MQIAKDKVVSIDYTLSDAQGGVLDSSSGQEPLHYLHGGGNIIPGLENALEGKSPGDAVQVTVPPEQGYGVQDPGAGSGRFLARRRLATPRWKRACSSAPRARTPGRAWSPW